MCKKVHNCVVIFRHQTMRCHPLSVLAFLTGSIRSEVTKLRFLKCVR